MARLVRLEEAGDTDIVIHVNKLKEGWDVTNLYTIVPLRASASDILTEQTLGRGLRLPYGERTGNEAVDTLTVIAHDRFDEVIKKAREADSLVQVKEYRIGEGGDISTEPQVVYTVPTAFEAALTGAKLPVSEDKVSGGGAQPFVFDKPEDRKVAQLTIELIRDKYERELKGGHKELQSPEVQQRITADVKRLSVERQGELEGIVVQPDVAKLVAVITASIAENSIEIPEIVVLPSREVNFWFEDFDLVGVGDIRLQPISDRLLVRNLRDQTQRELARALEGPKEVRVENYIVKYLMDYPQVDYDSQADLLYKLAGQMIEQALRKELTDWHRKRPVPVVITSDFDAWMFWIKLRQAKGSKRYLPFRIMGNSLIRAAKPKKPRVAPAGRRKGSVPSKAQKRAFYNRVQRLRGKRR